MLFIYDLKRIHTGFTFPSCPAGQTQIAAGTGILVTRTRFAASLIRRLIRWFGKMAEPAVETREKIENAVVRK